MASCRRHGSILPVALSGEVSFFTRAGKYVSALLKVAGETLERAADGLKSGKFQVQLFRASSRLYELLKANLPTEEEARGKMRRFATKMSENFNVLKKYAAAGVVRSAAYLSNLRKTSA